MAISSYAKINLFLKIGRKLSSGYHNLQSVMQNIELSDNMSIEPINEDRIIVESTNKDIENEENLVYKVASVLKKKYKVKYGIKIFIQKNIPLEAGLGGGSSNAATALMNLNRLWRLKLKEKQLINLASQIGSDVPFFVAENAALVEGIGEKIKRIKKSFSINVVLINPGFRVSTKWAYSTFDRKKPKIKTKADIKDLVKAIEKKDISQIADNLHNDFEPIVMKKYKVINDIKTNLLRNDALNALVSGSGPTVFGIFNSIYEAREAFFKIQYDYPFVFLTKTI
ncbi:4-(cytidine 5'-diphospho)-2-C-methyl-D-erythritol kinase [Candidatus Woesearchaeota archaeon]|jgi:4-diphosphocytidyl-2-C-methyl-D-erythritol kinase|nr:4-(cytidine 5'-diphospho)-2-C-methyl-D-erythritol kinase [Candidatus Woesearchaeota archaeon]MDP6648127.1 4-(cytidine 5'-diphospho)-2-C-methyl-D-erythritol kinase [Candidatus Woesearchaeota archaeon]|tara:strand:- start:81911 stop:82759 length:849 start_codon:yes stop_codon:yes gene_type:complete